MSSKSKVLALLAVTAIVCEVQALLTSNGMTVTLNDIPYYIPASPVATIECNSKKLGAATSLAGLVPLTVIQTFSLTFSQNDFAAMVANYTASDDVFQAGFLQGTYKFTFSMACSSIMKLSATFCSVITRLRAEPERPRVRS